MEDFVTDFLNNMKRTNLFINNLCQCTKYTCLYQFFISDQLEGGSIYHY